MARISDVHPFRSLKGRAGMVVDSNSEVSTVLVEFSKKNGSQWFMFVENWLLTPCQMQLLEIPTRWGTNEKLGIPPPPTIERVDAR